MNRYGVRHALFGTLPGRVVVIGVAVRLAAYFVALLLGRVPAFLSVIDTVASVALAIGTGYFIYQLIVLAKRHLLWRVRRKLILSYVFIGFVPAILIVLFFLLSGFLLFYNFGSYLVQSRLRAIGEQARFLAQSTALEIQRGSGRDAGAVISRRQANTVDEFAGLSIAAVPTNRFCGAAPSKELSFAETAVAQAGRWERVAVPKTIPGWIPCSGFSGVMAYSRDVTSAAADNDDGILVRAVACPDSKRPGYGIVVDLPVGAEILEQLRRETGVSITKLVVARDAADNVAPLQGLESGRPTPRPAPAGSGWLSNIPSVIEYSD